MEFYGARPWHFTLTSTHIFLVCKTCAPTFNSGSCWLSLLCAEKAVLWDTRTVWGRSECPCFDWQEILVRAVRRLDAWTCPSYLALVVLGTFIAASLFLIFSKPPPTPTPRHPPPSPPPHLRDGCREPKKTKVLSSKISMALSVKG